MTTSMIVFMVVFLALRQDSAFWVDLGEESSYVAFELNTKGQIMFSLLIGLPTGVLVYILSFVIWCVAARFRRDS